MNKKQKIKKLLKEGDAWERGERGIKSKVASKAENALIDKLSQMEVISIRLPQKLVDLIKKEAAMNGIGFKPYLRQVLNQSFKAKKRGVK